MNRDESTRTPPPEQPRQRPTMSDLFTEADVKAVINALGEDSWRRDGVEGTARAVLAAVVPAMRDRWQIELLDELIEQPVHPLTREWLLSVRERIAGQRSGGDSDGATRHARR
jgi:citrate lyase beta subunit